MRGHLAVASAHQLTTSRGPRDEALRNIATPTLVSRRRMQSGGRQIRNPKSEIQNSEFRILAFLQLPEYLEGLISLDPLVEHDPVVGGKDPSDTLGVTFLVTPDVRAE